MSFKNSIAKSTTSAMLLPLAVIAANSNSKLMKFPVIIIKENESPIFYFSEKSFGIVSRGGESFYQKGVMYDSDGNEFKITGVNSVIKANILTSLKYFQPMYKADVKSNRLGTVDLDQLKNRIITHINSNKKYWLQKDIVENLITTIQSYSTYDETISYFK